MIEHEGKQFDDTRFRPLEFSRRAARNLRNNECEMIVVFGMPMGIGKSAYVNHTLADVMGFLKEKDWNRLKWMFPRKDYGQRKVDDEIWEADYEAAKPLIKYEPSEVVTWLMGMLTKHEKVPMWHWDDGGVWLNAMEYNDPFVIAFMEFSSLMRSVCGVAVISTPVEEWVLKKLRTALGVIHAPVIKLGDDSHFWKPRRSTPYKRSHNPYYRKAICERQWQDDFTAIMPDAFYRWYSPVRDSYAVKSVARLAISLERRKAKGHHVEVDESILAEMKEDIADANDKSVELREIIAQTTAER